MFTIAQKVFPKIFLLMTCSPLIAQTYTLSGRVLDTDDHVVPSATVSVKSKATRNTFTAKTNGDGTYSISNLAAGDYTVWAVAGELQAPPIKVTLTAAQTTDLIVSPAPKAGPGAPKTPQQAPTPAPPPPSFADHLSPAEMR